MDSLIQVLAQALDMVEIAYLGASTNHGRRIAVLCAAMGRSLGLEETGLSDLVSCALLHDNALTEYILLQQGREEDAAYLGAHCEMGQRNLESIPFKGDVSGSILYHHERADGGGPFRLAEGEYPLAAELIAAADMLDVGQHLQRIRPEGLPELRRNIGDDIHVRFTRRAGEALLAVLDAEMLASLKDGLIAQTARRVLPPWSLGLDDPALVPIADLIGRIIDYKSNFTQIHTTQIACRAWLMAEHYGYEGQEKIQLYLAAALHDIGKLAIPPEVLEKPGKLDPEEFAVIKTHVTRTRELLEISTGMGNIVEWASNHHEKLDGSGYPLGKRLEDLDFNSRLMTCLDIYQAVSEERPYHPRRSHEDTMPILRDMAAKDAIDGEITADLDRVMAPWSGRDIPAPKPRG